MFSEENPVKTNAPRSRLSELRHDEGGSYPEELPKRPNFAAQGFCALPDGSRRTKKLLSDSVKFRLA